MRALPRSSSVLSFRRAVRVARLDAAREVHFLLQRGLRAYVVRTRGVAHDKRLLVDTRLAYQPAGRHLVQIVLRGRMRLADAGREAWLDEGAVSLQPHGFPDERWEGDAFEALVVEWSAPWSDGRVDGWTLDRLGPAELARLRAWAALTAAPPEPAAWSRAPALAAAHVAALLDLLASAGLPIARAPAGLLAEPVPPIVHAIAGALGASLSNLTARPALVDLEGTLGRSARHLRRGLADFHRYYDFPGGSSWQRLLHWWRLSTAATLMTARGATTELVAGALGYGSPRSFCLAMAQAGLPSPGKVARAVELLR